MRRTIRAILMALSLAGLAQAADRPLRILYVDMSRVVGAYQRRADLEGELQALQNDIAAQGRGRLEELNRMGQEIEQLAMGTPERLALQEKYRQAEKAIDEFRRETYEKLNARVVAMLGNLYQDVMVEVEALGKERDCDFILKDQSFDREATSRAEATLQISQRVVLYAKPEYDLTSVVIQRVNEKYAKTKTLPTGLPAAPDKEK